MLPLAYLSQKWQLPTQIVPPKSSLWVLFNVPQPQFLLSFLKYLTHCSSFLFTHQSINFRCKFWPIFPLYSFPPVTDLSQTSALLQNPICRFVLSDSHGYCKTPERNKTNLSHDFRCFRSKSIGQVVRKNVIMAKAYDMGNFLHHCSQRAGIKETTRTMQTFKDKFPITIFLPTTSTL